MAIISRCDSKIEGCTGEAIDFPLVDEEPDLVETVVNGKKFTVGNKIS